MTEQQDNEYLKSTELPGTAQEFRAFLTRLYDLWGGVWTSSDNVNVHFEDTQGTYINLNRAMTRSDQNLRRGIIDNPDFAMPSSLVTKWEVWMPEHRENEAYIRAYEFFGKTHVDCVGEGITEVPGGRDAFAAFVNMLFFQLGTYATEPPPRKGGEPAPRNDDQRLEIVRGWLAVQDKRDAKGRRITTQKRYAQEHGITDSTLRRWTREFRAEDKL